MALTRRDDHHQHQRASALLRPAGAPGAQIRRRRRRPGFTWAGVTRIANKREWPDWTPPAQMLRRRPDLPRHMEGGIDNPLGARAMYLAGTLYRIHGSNEPDDDRPGRLLRLHPHDQRRRRRPLWARERRRQGAIVTR